MHPYLWSCRALLLLITCWLYNELIQRSLSIIISRCRFSWMALKSRDNLCGAIITEMEKNGGCYRIIDVCKLNKDKVCHTDVSLSLMIIWAYSHHFLLYCTPSFSPWHSHHYVTGTERVIGLAIGCHKGNQSLAAYVYHFPTVCLAHEHQETRLAQGSWNGKSSY